MWPDDRDTRELLEAAKAGEESAAGRLFDRHRRAMLRVVAMRMDRRLARRVDASDIVQEALLVASRRFPDYLEGTAEIPFHLWLRRIALDRLLDAHRRHRVAGKRNMDRERPMYSDRSSRELAGQLADNRPTPGTIAIRAELSRRFEEAIDDLAEADREILLMRHFEHLSNREAATALGLSDAAAAMRYLRALRRLRETVDGGAA